jgi:hypothetical protein
MSGELSIETLKWIARSEVIRHRNSHLWRRSASTAPGTDARTWIARSSSYRPSRGTRAPIRRPAPGPGTESHEQAGRAADEGRDLVGRRHDTPGTRQRPPLSAVPTGWVRAVDLGATRATLAGTGDPVTDGPLCMNCGGDSIRCRRCGGWVMPGSRSWLSWAPYSGPCRSRKARLPALHERMIMIGTRRG